MNGMLCQLGIHQWVPWSAPYFMSDFTYYQARRCKRCGLVVTRPVPDYRSNKLADCLGDIRVKAPEGYNVEFGKDGE